MGEKGNADLTSATASMTAAGSTIERTFVSTSETVVGAGQDLASTIREKSIGAVADEAVIAARERLQGGEPPSAEPDDQTPPAT